MLLRDILMNEMQSCRTSLGSQFSLGLFLHGARHVRHSGRLRLEALILETFVAIMFPVVHSGTVEGPFIIICFIRHNVHGHRHIYESRPRTVAG